MADRIRDSIWIDPRDPGSSAWRDGRGSADGSDRQIVFPTGWRARREPRSSDLSPASIVNGVSRRSVSLDGLRVALRGPGRGRDCARVGRDGFDGGLRAARGLWGGLTWAFARGHRRSLWSRAGLSWADGPWSVGYVGDWWPQSCLKRSQDRAPGARCQLLAPAASFWRSQDGVEVATPLMPR